MTKLSEFEIYPVYDTDDDVRFFYNTVLSCANVYKRASAYFSDGFYNYIEKGLEKLIKNGGKMKLILSTEIDVNSLKAIKEGYSLKENKTEFINKCIKESVFDFEKVKDDMSIISFLIAIDRLDIKFVFKKVGLYHDKYSIIYDNFGNILLASGSNNETLASVAMNHESFETTLSWNNPSKHEISKIKKREEQFENTWNNNVDSLVCLPMTEVIKEDLINSIDYENIKKIVSNYTFIRMSIDEYNQIRIQSNLDLKKITTDYYYMNIIHYLEQSVSQNCILLNPLTKVKDVVEIKNEIERISHQNNAKFVLTESLSSYLSKYYLDMDELSILGTNIKNTDFINNSNDFLMFKDVTQNLLKRPLKNAQLQAAYHICQLQRSMNFSVPGSGKTSSILGAFEYLHSLDKSNPKHVDRILVLGPINCFKAWKDEFAIVSKRFDEYDPTQIINIKSVLNTSGKNTLLKYDFNKAKIILINFDIVNEVSDTIANLIDDTTMVVFDEIHRIKNYHSEKFNSCLKIVKGTNFRVALTGTPLPNGYIDLYVMFSLLYGQFGESYFGMNTEDLAKIDSKFLTEGIEVEYINKKIFPFYIRVTKDDLNIPKANADHVIYVEANKEETDLYKNILCSSMNDMSKAIRLVQVGCLPEKISFSSEATEIELNDFISDSDVYDDNIVANPNCLTSKLVKFLELIKTLNEKVVVWCTFVDTIEKVYKILENLNYKVGKIYGNILPEERIRIVDNFNKIDGLQILIANPHTLAESVSLHKNCHKAIYLELNYNLAQYLQSRDRIHRLGIADNQETDYYLFINTYSLNNKSSVDFEIYKRLLKKEKRMQVAIDKGSLLYTSAFGTEDVSEIIKDLDTGMGNK